MTPEQKSSLLEILEGARDMTVATLREDGYPQATTVSFVHDGLTIYFGCDPMSQKARNIERSDRISLTINLPYDSWSQIRGLSLGGRARFVEDRAELKSVYEAMIRRFPQLNDFATEAEQQQTSVVRVEPEVISLLDYRKDFGHTEEIRI